MMTGHVFFGWWVTAAFAVMVFLSSGIRFAVGPFLKPMVADLGLDRGQFSLVVAVSLLLYGALMPLIMAVAAFGGATMAGTIAMTSALTADIFGRFSVGTVFGTMFLIHQTGAALRSWLGGSLFDVTGGYGLAFLVACVLLLGACGTSLLVDERPRYLPRLAPVAGGR